MNRFHNSRITRQVLFTAIFYPDPNNLDNRTIITITHPESREERIDRIARRIQESGVSLLSPQLVAGALTHTNGRR